MRRKKAESKGGGIRLNSFLTKQAKILKLFLCLSMTKMLRPVSLQQSGCRTGRVLPYFPQLNPHVHRFSRCVSDDRARVYGCSLIRCYVKHSVGTLGKERLVQIKNWMSKRIVRVEEDTPITRVSKALEDHQIRHLPVTRNGRLVGLIMDRDVKEALPSRSTSLSAQELYHLLSEVKARDVMQPDPVTIQPEHTVEAAAVRMLEHKITGMPVVTEEGNLVGMISQGDVFRVLIAITGIYQGGIQFAFILEDTPGSIRQVADVIRQEKGHIVSILSMTDTVEKGYRKVFFRIKAVPEKTLHAMVEKLEQCRTLLYVSQDPLKGTTSPSNFSPLHRAG